VAGVGKKGSLRAKMEMNASIIYYFCFLSIDMPETRGEIRGSQKRKTEDTNQIEEKSPEERRTRSHQWNDKDQRKSFFMNKSNLDSNNSKCTIMTINVRGLIARKEELLQFTITNSVDIACIQETWITALDDMFFDTHVSCRCVSSPLQMWTFTTTRIGYRKHILLFLLVN
jgi:hypothetical protein